MTMDIFADSAYERGQRRDRINLRKMFFILLRFAQGIPRDQVSCKIKIEKITRRMSIQFYLGQH